MNLRTLWLVVALVFAGSVYSQEKSEVEKSVVRVVATQQWPNVLQPWRKISPRAMMGSGTIIEGNRILTNAHVVTYATDVDVLPYRSSERYAAQVEAIAPEMDLAVLKIKDEAFFKARPPLKLAKRLPKAQDAVRVYGYPVGGIAQRTIDGRVSRVEYALYTYNSAGLRVEINATISAGNSGGPAILDGQVVGIVHAASVRENIGYLTPNEEIAEFLRDIGDGKYDGKPKVWADFRGLENDALRAKLGLTSNTTGVLMRADYPQKADYPLKKGDVITHVGDFSIDNTGMVNLNEKDLRLPVQYLIPELAKDNAIGMTVLRQGKSQRISVPVKRRWPALVPDLNSGRPSYFVWGPLVFSPATSEAVDFLATVVTDAQSPLFTRRGDLSAFAGEQLVIVTWVFPHKTLKGYSDPRGQVVQKVNGTRIRHFRDLIETLRKANEKEERFVELEFAGELADPLVFDRQVVMDAMDDILVNNVIPRQFSNDVRDVWLKSQPAKNK